MLLEDCHQCFGGSCTWLRYIKKKKDFWLDQITSACGCLTRKGFYRRKQLVPSGNDESDGFCSSDRLEVCIRGESFSRPVSAFVGDESGGGPNMRVVNISLSISHRES